MLGATIGYDVQHSSLKSTRMLNKALLQNPYYDYSDLKRQVLSIPFSDNLMELQRMSGLEELHL